MTTSQPPTGRNPLWRVVLASCVAIVALSTSGCIDDFSNGNGYGGGPSFFGFLGGNDGPPRNNYYYNNNRPPKYYRSSGYNNNTYYYDNPGL